MKTIFSAVLAATFACSIFTSCANSNTEKLLGNWQLTFFEKDGVAQEIAIATVNIKSEFKILSEWMDFLELTDLMELLM